MLAHHTVRGGRGKHHRGAKLLQPINQLLRPGFLKQRHAGANRHGEQHLPAQPKGKRDGRAADEHIVRIGLQNRLRPAGAYRHHITVKMHGGLGHTRGARGKTQQAGVGSSSVQSREFGAGLVHQGFQRIINTFGLDVEVAHGVQRVAFFLRALHLSAQRVVTQRVADLGDVHNRRQLLGAQQRHGSHGNTTGLDDAKPASHHHGVIGRAQQHAVARHQTQITGQHIGNLVGLGLQLRISPAQTGGLNAKTIATPLRHMLVQQLGHTVHALGELKLRQIEDKLRLQLHRWQMVCRKRINVSGVGHDFNLLYQNRGFAD